MRSIVRPAYAVRALAVAAVLAVVVGCDAPGKGSKAERGYRRAAPVVAALARFRVERGQYPDSLSQLVPTFLPEAALALPSHPQEQYPLEYRREADQYGLTFRYVGPGTNECTYRSQADAWDCGGLY